MNTKGLSAIHLNGIIILFLILIPIINTYAEVLDADAATILIADQGNEVVIPSTYNSIGDGAFSNTELTSVVIPDSVISIGAGAFYDLSSLNSVTMTSTVTSIGVSAFSGTGLTSVVIPDSVTTIGSGAFYDCADLTAVTIGNSVETIGDGAFANTGLTSVVIPDSVITLNPGIFGTTLTTVTIGSPSIGAGAFDGLSNLTSVTIGNSVTSIPVSTFDGLSNLTSVTIGNSVTSIPVSTFDGLSNLTSVTIGNSVTEIGASAFSGTGLTSVVIPDSVTTIGSGAFAGTQLTSVTIGNSVEAISDGAFYGTGLTSVVIPDSVISIGGGAFAGTQLTSVTIGNSVEAIGGGAFNGTGLTSLTIPDSVTTIGNGAFSDTSLSEVIIMVSEEVGNYPDFSASFDSDSVTVIYSAILDSTAAATLLAGGNEVVIPDTYTTIGDNAFAETQLSSVVIPDSVTTIGDYAFSNCSGLTSVTIGNSVTSIGASAFNGTGLTSVEIPDSVTSIAESAFISTPLTTVTIQISEEVGNYPDFSASFDDGVVFTYLTSKAITNLLRGANMIGLPLKPSLPYTAKSLSQYLAGNSQNTKDDNTDVTWIVRYDSQNPDPNQRNFQTYIWDLDKTENGFDIQGGQGYIVNVSSNRAITFWGQPWTGELNPAPSSMVENNTWAFLVGGDLTSQMVAEDENYLLKSTNLTSGKQLAEMEHQGYNFRLPLIDFNRQEVVAEGDLVEVEVIGSNGKRIANGQFRVNQQELATAYRLVEIEYNPVPDLTRLLQNYPNPFNPETWIPYELSQDSEVKVWIYDVGGQLVRWMEVGFQEAGIYSSREKAIYWDGKSQDGERVASGVYFYSLEMGEESQTRRMVILK